MASSYYALPYANTKTRLGSLLAPPTQVTPVNPYAAQGMAMSVYAKPPPRTNPAGPPRPPDVQDVASRIAAQPINTNPQPLSPWGPPTPQPTVWTGGDPEAGAPTWVPGTQGALPDIDPKALYANALQSDPAYAQAMVLAAAQRKQIAGGFLARLKQELLGYGSQDYARSVLDPLVGELSKYTGQKLNLADFYNTVSSDPETSFSTLGQLNRLTPRALQTTTENVNRANLFYSGHGAQAIGDQTYTNQKAYSDADQAIQSQIMNDRQSYLQGLGNVDLALAQAAEAAYSRALQQAYTYGLYYAQQNSTPGYWDYPQTNPYGTTSGPDYGMGNLPTGGDSGGRRGGY